MAIEDYTVKTALAGQAQAQAPRRAALTALTRPDVQQAQAHGMPATVRHVFITGEPGIGKSTIISHVLARLATAVEAVGFMTSEQLDPQGRRIGFRSINVADKGDMVQLASLEETPPDGRHIGPFHVHLDEAVSFCSRVLSPISNGERPRLYFMDEIGAMQLLSREMQQLVSQVVDDSATHCVGTLPSSALHDLPFVEALRRRSDVKVLDVTKENRNEMVGVVCSLLYQMCFTEEVAQAIEAKALLARRYVKDFFSRLESADGEGLAFRFRGEHGTYEMRCGSMENAFSCTCPFFTSHGTCSHTLAFALDREARDREDLALEQHLLVRPSLAAACLQLCWHMLSCAWWGGCSVPCCTPTRPATRVEEPTVWKVV